MQTSRDKGKLMGWLKLIRPPNLLTVPGDPLAGFLLTSTAAVHPDFLLIIPAAGATLFLYSAGLIWNDCADLQEDRQLRPDRPLPSGAITLRSAVLTANLFLAAGLICAALSGIVTLSIAMLLLILILLYNFGTKNIPALGALNMGLCRGASLLLGASCAGNPSLWPPTVFMAALILILYISLVTHLAGRETDPDSGIHPHTIGALLRGLLLLQSILCATVQGPGYTVAAILLLLWLPSKFLAKWFYAS